MGDRSGCGVNKGILGREPDPLAPGSSNPPVGEVHETVISEALSADLEAIETGLPLVGHQYVARKHQQLLQDLPDASPYLNILLRLISERTLVLLRPDDELTRKAYNLSLKHRTPFYDAVFIALALQLKLKLETLDKAQIQILTEENQAK